MIYIQYTSYIDNKTRKELDTWIDNSLSECPSETCCRDVYGFVNKDDAAFFMLTWGIGIIDHKKMEMYELMAGT